MRGTPTLDAFRLSPEMMSALGQKLTLRPPNELVLLVPDADMRAPTIPHLEPKH
jgi:hypothetical protein